MSSHPTDDDCLFCSIVAENVPARTVGETEETLAFLDVNPLAPGHTLVIPKGHYETIAEMPSDVASAVFDEMAALTSAIESAVDADASNVGFNNGAAAGQEIPHLHGHIVPRYHDDGGRPIHAVAGTRPDLSEEELDEIRDEIAASR